MADVVRRKLIWVEDDSFLNDLVAQKLDHHNFELVPVGSSAELFSALEKGIPDAIILDLLLPAIDGFAIMERLKGDTRFRGVPVIVVSNLSQQSDMERAKALGAVRYLVKADMTIDEILKEVGAILRHEAPAQSSAVQ